LRRRSCLRLHPGLCLRGGYDFHILCSWLRGRTRWRARRATLRDKLATYAEWISRRQTQCCYAFSEVNLNPGATRLRPYHRNQWPWDYLKHRADQPELGIRITAPNAVPEVVCTGAQHWCHTKRP
jgi:hypothetical protein